MKFLSFQPTVKVRNGVVLLNGDFEEDDIVPTKFKPVNDDAEIVVKLDDVVTKDEALGNCFIKITLF